MACTPCSSDRDRVKWARKSSWYRGACHRILRVATAGEKQWSPQQPLPEQISGSQWRHPASGAPPACSMSCCESSGRVAAVAAKMWSATTARNTKERAEATRQAGHLREVIHMQRIIRSRWRCFKAERAGRDGLRSAIAPPPSPPPLRCAIPRCHRALPPPVSPVPGPGRCPAPWW